MNLDETMPILEFIFNKANNSRKWKECLSIPFQFNEDYSKLKESFDDLPNIPLTTLNGDYIDIINLVQTLFSFNKAESFFISLFVTSPIENNIIGFKISFNQKYDAIDIELVRLILSSITKHDITISDLESQNCEGMVKVDNGNELLYFTFDFDSFTINGYSSISQEKKDSCSISFFAKSNILNEFYTFINKCMVSMIYRSDKSLNVSLGSNSLLLNIPKTQNRFLDFAEFLFPGSSKHIYSHTEKSEEINALSSSTMIHLALPTKNSNSNASASSKLLPIQNNINSQIYMNGKNQVLDSIFCLFTFLNGIPQESNCQMSLDILSSIIWSDLSISFVPMSIENKSSGNQSCENFHDDFKNYIEYSRQIPYCTCSTIIGKPGTVILAFLNTTKESAKAISRIALVKSFEKMQSSLTKTKSYVRLNRIWQSVDTIATSISNILDYEPIYEEVWNGCCSVLAKSNNRQTIKKNPDNMKEDNDEYNEI